MNRMDTENKNFVEKNRNKHFTHGFLAGILITCLICFMVVVCGLSTYLFLEKPQFLSDEVTGKIDARKGWQNTDVWVKPGNRVEITVINGKWTHWEGTQPYNSGSGGGYVCGKAMKPSDCVEPLPEFATGGLIGRVGKEVFAIGPETTWKSTESGRLELRINDADHGLYDNDGELEVKIQIDR
jgi:hypothetical protein